MGQMADQFWGDRCGTFTDPHGYSWTIATHKEDLTPRGDGAAAGGVHEAVRRTERSAEGGGRRRLTPSPSVQGKWRKESTAQPDIVPAILPP